MRFIKFDTETYIQTQNLSGAPVCRNIEEEIPEIAMIVDESGRPTRGGAIGYGIAYIIMIGFVGALFFFL